MFKWFEAIKPAAVPATVGSTMNGKTLLVPVEIGNNGTSLHPRTRSRCVPSPPREMTDFTPSFLNIFAASVVSVLLPSG